MKSSANAVAPAPNVPTLAQVTKWYTSLLKTGSYDTDYEVQAFFYDPIYSDDADTERVFEAWADTVSTTPMQMVEWELAEAKNWTELPVLHAAHAGVARVCPASHRSVREIAEATRALPRNRGVTDSGLDRPELSTIRALVR
ncbi:MAG: hypothetical protein QM831_34995 [Kofleriaceae bacterium]